MTNYVQHTPTNHTQYNKNTDQSFTNVYFQWYKQTLSTAAKCSKEKTNVINLTKAKSNFPNKHKICQKIHNTLLVYYCLTGSILQSYAGPQKQTSEKKFTTQLKSNVYQLSLLHSTKQKISKQKN